MAYEDVDVQVGCLFASKSDLFNIKLHRSRAGIHYKLNDVFSIILTDPLQYHDYWSHFDLKIFNCAEKCLDSKRKSKEYGKGKKSKAKFECRHRNFFKACTHSCHSGRGIRIFRPAKSQYNDTKQIRYDGLFRIGSFTDSADGLSRVFRFVYSDSEPLSKPPVEVRSQTCKTVYKKDAKDDDDVLLVTGHFHRSNHQGSLNVKQEPEVFYNGEGVSDAELNFQRASLIQGDNQIIPYKTTRTDHLPQEEIDECSVVKEEIECISEELPEPIPETSRPRYSIADDLRLAADIGRLYVRPIRSRPLETEDSQSRIFRSSPHKRKLPETSHEDIQYDTVDEIDDFCPENYIELPLLESPNVDPLENSEDAECSNLDSLTEEFDDKTNLISHPLSETVEIKSESAEEVSELPEVVIKTDEEVACSSQTPDPVDISLQDTIIAQIEKALNGIRPRIYIYKFDLNSNSLTPISDRLNRINLSAVTLSPSYLCDRLKNCIRHFLNSLIYYKRKMDSPPRSLFNVYSAESPTEDVTIDDIAVIDDVPFHHHDETCHKERCIYNLKFGTIMNMIANKETCPCSWESDFPKFLKEMQALTEYVLYNEEDEKSELVKCARNSSHFVGLVKKMTENGKTVAKRNETSPRPEWAEPHIRIFHNENGIVREKSFEEIACELIRDIQQIIKNPSFKERHPECKNSVVQVAKKSLPAAKPKTKFSGFSWSESGPLPPPEAFRGFNKDHISRSRLKFFRKTINKRLFKF